MIDPAHDIMMITDSGTIVRVHAEEISCIGRDTQGVRVMRIKGAGEIVSIVTTPHEDDEPEETENLEQTAAAADEAIASETVQEFPEE